MGVRQVDQGAEEVVPLADEGQHRDGCESRPELRQNNGPEDPQRSGTVDLGCLVEVVGNATDELAQEEDEEGGAEEGGHDLGQKLEQIVVPEERPTAAPVKDVDEERVLG